MSPADIARLAAALLDAVEHGDVEATPAELAFLRSLAGRRAPKPARP